MKLPGQRKLEQLAVQKFEISDGDRRVITRGWRTAKAVGTGEFMTAITVGMSVTRSLITAGTAVALTMAGKKKREDVGEALYQEPPAKGE